MFIESNNTEAIGELGGRTFGEGMRTRGDKRGTQGTKFKVVLALKDVHKQDQHLRVSSALNLSPQVPRLPHPSPAHSEESMREKQAESASFILLP